MPWPGWRWRERCQSARVVVVWWVRRNQRQLGASVKSDDVAMLHHPQKSNHRATPTTICLPTAAERGVSWAIQKLWERGIERVSTTHVWVPRVQIGITPPSIHPPPSSAEIPIFPD